MIGEPMSEQSWQSSDESQSDAPRFACDAMCGGLARWLRAYGYDTSYTEGIADLDLVRTAQSESRILISSDGPLFERRVIRDRIVGSYRLERGLKLLEQFRHIVREFRLLPGPPRCTVCNGVLAMVAREHVADRVPARSLLWATEFSQCRECQKVYWNGSHWRRIRRVRESMAQMIEAMGSR